MLGFDRRRQGRGASREATEVGVASLSDHVSDRSLSPHGQGFPGFVEIPMGCRPAIDARSKVELAIVKVFYYDHYGSSMDCKPCKP